MGVEHGNGDNVGQKVNQDQIQDLLFGERLSWQAIIYDLINTEQLDPWDLDLSLLTERYLEKIQNLEMANFFISSKVLFAASLLLRIKSEILLNNYIPSLDDILYGKKEEKKYIQERIELDEEIPELIPRTPLPRYRKVTLQELMHALGKAIKTENRRIKKVVVTKQHEKEVELSLPRSRINLKDQIKSVYDRLLKLFKDREDKISFSYFTEGSDKDGRVANFVPLLHLDNQHRVLLEQEGHGSEIWIWTKKLHDKKNKALLELMIREAEDEIDTNDETEVIEDFEDDDKGVIS